MHWLILLSSGMLEAVWAVALARTEGFTRWVPSLVFGVAVCLSMGGLAYGLREIPVGTGYAVWVAVGAVTTAVYGMVALGEPVSVARVLCLALIISGVVGLKLLS